MFGSSPCGTFGLNCPGASAAHRGRERALRIDRESFFAQWNLMRGHAWAGDLERAIAVAPSMLRESGRHQWVLGLLAWVFCEAGQADRARAVFDELEARSRHEFVSPFWLAVAASSAGLREPAMEYVGRAVSERDPLVVWARVHPMWSTIRTYPGFETVTRSVWG